MRHLVTILALFVALAPGSAMAALVRGVTRAAGTGEPLGFVNVQLLGKEQGGTPFAIGMMSSAEGVFEFATVPLGQYVLRCGRVGYAMREDSLKVDMERDYRLEPALTVAPVPMKEIRVNARALPDISDTQTGYVGIRGERLSALPGIAEGDPVRTLQLIPGVKASSDFSSALYVRGGGPDQTLVLLDGATVYNPTHAFGFFSTFNPDATGNVELYKGAYPAEHGGRLGSVLDIHTRDASAHKFAGKAGVSTIAARLSLEGGLGKGSWNLSGRRTYLEPLLSALRKQGNNVPNYYFYDTNGRLSVPAGKGRFDVSVYAGSDKLDFPLDAQTYFNLDWGNRVASASYARVSSENLVWTTRVSYSEYESKAAAAVFNTPVAYRNSIHDITGASDLKWRAGLSHTVTTGLQAARYDVSFSQDFNLENTVDYRRTPVELAMYVADRYTPWGETTIDAGVRMSYIDDGKRWLAEPRLSFSQALSETMRAKLGGGFYHQYLQLVSTEGISAADFYVPIDASAEIGESWQAVAGLDWRLRPALLASIEGYYTSLSNLVQLDNTTAGDAGVVTADDLFYLGGTGYATGMELFLRRDMGALTGWLGYTLGWTRRTFPEVNQGREFPPKYDRRNDLSAVLEYTTGKWHLTGAFVLSSGQAFTPVSGRYSLVSPTTGTLPSDIELLYADKNSARLLPYNRLDLGVARRFSLFGARAEWMVEVFNVYSRRNEWFVQYTRDQNTVTADTQKMLPIVPSIGVNVWF